MGLINSTEGEFLWTEKYRPRTVKETILPAALKDTFQKFVDDKQIPNIILAGRAGVGKTTIARAMIEELGSDYILVNASLEGNIDTLRTKILSFASSVSLEGNGRKYVILDEADHLNPQSTQPALRAFMEQFSMNCGFILTCNYPARIIEALHSRCPVVPFKITKADAPEMASRFYKRCEEVLVEELIPYNKDALVELVKKYYPDMRRMLGELQRYAASGKIDKGILTNLSADSVKKLLASMKEKDFTNVRKWVGENSDTDFVTIGRRLFDGASTYFAPASIPQLVLTLADYQYKAVFVADQEINTSAALATIMVECEFK